ncbi:protein of unknown function [Candidatus Nitrospira inopinata]|uniref:Uncharacterized protein n=1 Tax=Candidatus Nitrospira inopinata TaxID=1715989 RepID=A0A0S4KZI0_9BACT|nr:protein of unknown function [Candidatus Nitrospira inopinata]
MAYRMGALLLQTSLFKDALQRARSKIIAGPPSLDRFGGMLGLAIRYQPSSSSGEPH